MNKESYRTVTRPRGLRAWRDNVPTNGGLNLKGANVVATDPLLSEDAGTHVEVMSTQITSDSAPDGARGSDALIVKQL